MEPMDIVARTREIPLPQEVQLRSAVLARGILTSPIVEFLTMKMTTVYLKDRHPARQATRRRDPSPSLQLKIAPNPQPPSLQQPYRRFQSPRSLTPSYSSSTPQISCSNSKLRWTVLPIPRRLCKSGIVRMDFPRVILRLWSTPVGAVSN